MRQLRVVARCQPRSCRRHCCYRRRAVAVAEFQRLTRGAPHASPLCLLQESVSPDAPNAAQPAGATPSPVVPVSEYLFIVFQIDRRRPMPPPPPPCSSF